VFDGALRAIAVVTSVIIALSFILFAAEEVSDASKQQQTAVVDPGPRAGQARAQRHTKAREAIDDANDVVLRPFAGLVEGSSSAWVQRGVPTLLGLLLYGIGLAYLARLLQVRSHTLRPHRAPPARPAAHGDSAPPPAS
jgi:hypothetical protein